jgi:hypothetical protein
VTEFGGTNGLGNLKRRMKLLNEGKEVAAFTSCHTTMTILLEFVNNNPMQSLPMVRALSLYQETFGKPPSTRNPVEIINEIATLLDGPNMLGISIKPDHNFVVFPLGKHAVVVLQSFEGTYSLESWLKCTAE